MNWEIFNTVVGIIQIIVSVVLIISVLMQSAKKEGMAGIVGGASETFFGKNKGRTLDSKFAVITTASAIIFLITSVLLTFGVSRLSAPVVPEVTPDQVQTDTVDLTTDVEDGDASVEDTTEENAEGNTEEAAE